MTAKGNKRNETLGIAHKQEPPVWIGRAPSGLRELTQQLPRVVKTYEP